MRLATHAYSDFCMNDCHYMVKDSHNDIKFDDFDTVDFVTIITGTSVIRTVTETRRTSSTTSRTTLSSTMTSVLDLHYLLIGVTQLDLVCTSHSGLQGSYVHAQ